MSNVSFSQLAEQEARLQRQRRNSSIASTLIAFLVVALIMVILGFILLPSLNNDQTPIVTYKVNSDDEPDIKKKKVTTSVSKPSPPSAQTAKAITANTQSPVSIPVPDVNVPEPSMEFGIGDDFGEMGWDGDGFGSGTATFFNQTSKAQRVCYVIDYSGSMRGKRDELMRVELTKSIKELSAGMHYQMLFFAGPVWQAGDKIKGGKSTPTVVTEDGDEYKWKSSGGAHGYNPVGDRQIPEWKVFDGQNLEDSLKHIKETKLIYGTIWDHPLEMALSMEPKPQIIFFMTDGAAGNRSMKIAEEVGKEAGRLGIVINTVALMQPRAIDGLKELAKRTAGQFTIVEEDGEVKNVPVN